MSSLQAQALLRRVAALYGQKKIDIPKGKIKEKIKNLKYLSSQKKVPKLSLRKEILHLESQLDEIFKIEKVLLKKRKDEASKIAVLKRQNTMLKKKLESLGSKQLHRQVGKLTHLMGEALAQKDTAEEIKIAQKVVKPFVPPSVDVVDRQRKVQALQQRLVMLKQELAILKHTNKEPDQVERMEKAIAKIEDVLRKEGAVQEKVKHTVMFGLPRNSKVVVEREIPTPPPIKLSD